MKASNSDTGTAPTADVEMLVERFDHLSQAFATIDTPNAVYEQLRARCPVAHTDAHGGFYVVSRYENVVAIAKDTDTFSSAGGITMPDGTEGLPSSELVALLEEPRNFASIVNLDPPAHTPVRQAMTPLFTDKALSQFEPYLHQIADEAIDSFIERGTCNIFDDYCAPIPARMTLRMIGMDDRDWKRWSDVVLHYFGETIGQIDASVLDVASIMATIAARRSDPTDDLTSYLVKTKVDGRLLEDGEIAGLINTLLMAGLDTTVNTVASAIVELARRPDLRQQLASADENADIWKTAIEEFLRFTCPVQGFRRTVHQPAEVDGVQMSPGERVLILWASANRDPEAFDNPDEIDLGRKPNRHLSFGFGKHHCLGANLARQEIRIMLQHLLRRIPEFTVGDDLEAHRNCSVVYGYRAVPFHFTPGGKR